MDVVSDAGTGQDDLASADSAEPVGLDLRPSEGGQIRRTRRADQRKWPWIVVLVAIVAGIGFVASHAVGDATVFYLNADEAVARKPDLGVKRFRLQGHVKAASRIPTADGVNFVVEFNGTDVAVHHTGDPADLFQDCIPVVLEGHWSDTGPAATFQSDFMIVKHTEEYDAANADRLKQAKADGISPACLSAGQTTPVAGAAVSP